VQEALRRLDRGIAEALRESLGIVKLIHGYGSTGAGGDIRIAVQKKLREMAECGEIRGCIFGEDWAKSDETSWRLVQAQPELKRDPDLGKQNRGITIVLL